MTGFSRPQAEAADPVGAGELAEEEEGVPGHQGHPGQAGAAQQAQGAGREAGTGHFKLTARDLLCSDSQLRGPASEMA